jgi:hypothetical protein
MLEKMRPPAAMEEIIRHDLIYHSSTAAVGRDEPEALELCRWVLRQASLAEQSTASSCIKQTR